MTRQEIFQRDLKAAKPSERETLKALQRSYLFWTFEDVSDNPDCYYKGDIKATNLLDNTIKYIDVKNDSRIADTGNILCEEYVVDEWGRKRKGNMFSDYDYIAIYSGQNRSIYILDFSIIKERYKEGEFKIIPHRAEGTETECYLLPLWKAKKYKALLRIISLD